MGFMFFVVLVITLLVSVLWVRILDRNSNNSVDEDECVHTPDDCESCLFPCDSRQLELNNEERSEHK